MSLFFLCSEAGCNKKYKTRDKLVGHLLECHKITDPVVGEPLEITKDNRKSVETKRNNNRKKEQMDQKIKEIEQQKQMELEAKREAEEQIRLAQIEKYRALEIEKLRVEEERVKLESGWVTTIEKVHGKVGKGDDCCICSDCVADTAIVPCGHKHFCYSCIDTYHKTFPVKGCPICRKHIQSLVRIYA